LLDDFDARASVLPVRGRELGDLEDDGAGVIVGDEAGIAEGVEERLAASGEVVGVEELLATADNADESAAWAARLWRVRCQWFLPRRVLREGVT
jgi:hypothetical protein